MVYSILPWQPLVNPEKWGSKVVAMVIYYMRKLLYDYSLHVDYTKELFTKVYSAIEGDTCITALKPSPLCSKPSSHRATYESFQESIMLIITIIVMLCITGSV